MEIITGQEKIPIMNGLYLYINYKMNIDGTEQKAHCNLTIDNMNIDRLNSIPFSNELRELVKKYTKNDGNVLSLESLGVGLSLLASTMEKPENEPIILNVDLDDDVEGVDDPDDAIEPDVEYTDTVEIDEENKPENPLLAELETHIRTSTPTYTSKDFADDSTQKKNSMTRHLKGMMFMMETHGNAVLAIEKLNDFYGLVLTTKRNMSKTYPDSDEIDYRYTEGSLAFSFAAVMQLFAEISSPFFNMLCDEDLIEWSPKKNGLIVKPVRAKKTIIKYYSRFLQPLNWYERYDSKFRNWNISTTQENIQMMNKQNELKTEGV